MAQWVENMPAMRETQETQVQSLNCEDSLDKEMATHSSILDWKIPWAEEPGGLQFTGSQSRTPLSAHTCTPPLPLDNHECALCVCEPAFVL